MATLIDYVRDTRDTFLAKPLGRVDALCLAWLSYLRLPEGWGLENRAGARLADLADDRLLPALTSGLHDAERTAALLRALGESPRFGNVRACLHASEADEREGMQFSATTFVLPEGAGAVVAFRGTDDTMLGWKENLRLACSVAIPAERRAVTYLQDAVRELGGSFWVCGHSKGGALAVYACGMAADDVRAQLEGCLSFDGPGLAPELLDDPAWHNDVPLRKVIPHESLVGMLFERSQEGMAVVRSTAEGTAQHSPLTWEVATGDFVCEQGMAYDAWRLAQRLNDWLDGMGADERARFAELVGWLADTTGEVSLSGLLARWSSNARAMQAALEAAPADDRALLARVLDDLVATLLLGSAREHGLCDADTPAGKADAASRKVEDLMAHTNDRLSRLDRLTGR